MSYLEVLPTKGTIILTDEQIHHDRILREDACHIVIRLWQNDVLPTHVAKHMIDMLITNCADRVTQTALEIHLKHFE